MCRYGLPFAILAVALLGGPTPGRAVAPVKAIVVIVNQHVPARAISQEELRAIFQTRKKSWSDGSTIRPFNLPSSHLVRQAFDRSVVGLEPDQMARFWIDRRIRGGDRPPDTAPSLAIMVRVVGALAGAIGYAEPNALDAGVQVVARIVDGQVAAP